MKSFLLAAALVSFATTSAFAGGPVVVVDGGPVEVSPPPRGSVGSGPIIGVVAGLALLCLIACGGSDSAPDTTVQE